MQKIVGAIRAEDPQRLVISDGMQCGQHPIYELRDLGISLTASCCYVIHLEMTLDR